MNLPSIPKSFFNGDCFDAYRILGAHPWQGDHGEEGWRFAVWAPGATAVEVCGGFDGWGAGIPLQKADTGVWSGFVSGLCEGELYKYRIHGADGSVVMRADPYAFASEVRPANASRLTKLDFSFDDSAWMERRDKCRNLPMNIYELHAGSWKHKNTGNIIRTCMATGSRLHLIEPLGFSLDEKHLRRSGMDYIKDADIHIHKDWNAFVAENPCEHYYFMTRYGKKAPSEFDFTKEEGDVYLVLGKESTGVDKKILKGHLDTCMRLPMVANARSLNLSNCAAIIVYEVLRQLDYPGLSTHEELKGEDWLENLKVD